MPRRRYLVPHNDDVEIHLLGARGLASAIRSRGEDESPSPVVATGLLSVIGVTIANGADNISVYTPTFRTIGVTGSLVTVVVFAVGVAVWCLAGSWLGSHRTVIDLVQHYGLHSVPRYRFTVEWTAPHRCQASYSRSL